MLTFLSGAFLGWSLGANDSANIFGTAVSSHMVSYKKAVILISIFVIIGSIIAGEDGIQTLKSITTMDLKTSTITTFSAAICVTFMTFMKIPVSTSQAIGGAIFGIAFINNSMNYQVFTKMIICWIATPIGGIISAIILYHFFAVLFRLLKPNIYLHDSWLRFGLIVCGCYGAYSLGANNVANCAAVFTGTDNGLLSANHAVIVGGICIAFGTITYSRRVMMTVGTGIVKLDAFSAFICVLAHSVTLHIFAKIGVPVSSSQAVVGAVIGISIIKGLHLINYKTLISVFAGWTATPFVGAGIAILLSNILSN